MSSEAGAGVREPESSAARACRTVSAVVCGLLVADLLLIVVTGGMSFASPFGRVGQGGFIFRELLLALALVSRFRFFSARERRVSAGQLMLMLAILPSLFHLHFIGRRITGDAVYYYVFTRSMIRDADVDFANEYEHYDLLTRGDFSVPTSTGHRRSIYSVGPGVLWVPFFVGADGLATVLQSAGFPVNTSGYGPFHLNAVALGSFSFGIVGLFLTHAFLRRHFGDRLATAAVLFLWWASFVPWYLAEQPITSHPASILLVAIFFLIRQNGALRSMRGSFGIGLALGVAMSVRWQNGVYLLLPAIDLLIELRNRAPLTDILKRGSALSAALLIGIAPQMLAWKAIYGEYLLRYPPHGADFLRLDRPFLLNTLFSSRHGLLSWTPVFTLCLIGLFLLARDKPRRFGLLWLPVLIVTYVNASGGDWWSGGAYSGRRFDSLFPIYALGLAAFLAAAVRFVRKRPLVAPATLVACAAVWSVSFSRALREREAPDNVPVSFAGRSLASTQSVSNLVGFPTTWPASWIFAARFDASPGAFDRAAGKYLFYRQNNLDGIAEIGDSEDDALRLEGFSGPKQEGPVAYRTIESSARLIVSLDLPEALVMSVQARSGAVTSVRVLVNNEHVGEMNLTSGWSEVTISTRRDTWRRGPNTVHFEASSPMDLDRVTFRRSEP